MADWSLDLTQYAKKLKVKVEDVRKTYAFALYSSIVKKTPVDTGRARGNWNVSVGKPDPTVEGEEKYPKSSGKNKAKPPVKLKYSAPKELPNPKEDESIFICNNLPYIESLEFGSSKQSPQGMVGVTLANNENIFKAAVNRVKGGSE